jgi:hypothetical protein
MTLVAVLRPAASKRAWSVKDSIDTIREAQAWNRAIDKRCGMPRT